MMLDVDDGTIIKDMFISQGTYFCIDIPNVNYYNEDIFITDIFCLRSSVREYDKTI